MESSAAGIEATFLTHNALLAGHAELGNLEEADAIIESMSAGQVTVVPHPRVVRLACGSCAPRMFSLVKLRRCMVRDCASRYKLINCLGTLQRQLQFSMSMSLETPCCAHRCGPTSAPSRRCSRLSQAIKRLRGMRGVRTLPRRLTSRSTMRTSMCNRSPDRCVADSDL